MKRKRNFSVMNFFVLMIGIFILFSVSNSEADTGDDSEGTDLRDVVTALQVCAGMSPADVHNINDVDGDGKIGLAEVIHGLVKAANSPLILPVKTFEESSLNFSYQETGIVRFLRAETGYAIAQPTELAISASPEEAARAFLSVHGSIFGMKDQSSELGVIKTQIAKRERTFVRFQQKHSGIPIIGGEMIVQMDAAKSIMSVSGEMLNNSDMDALNTRPSISAETARQTALTKIAEVHERNVGELDAAAPELRIYNPTIFGFSEPDENMLVWHTEVNPLQLDAISEFVLVDAHSGEVVLHFNQIDSVKNRLTYNAQHSSNLPGVLCRSEGDGNSGDSDCDQAHDYAGDTYDFYLREHGRNGIDNAGMEMISTVHFFGYFGTFFCNCNAFWSGYYEQMVYCDGCGIVVDDVVAHELTHGVTDHESDLKYLNQSGAINESFSDIWGEFIDQNNGKGTDTPEVRWKMGEDIPGGQPFRDMKNPTLYGDPDRITSDLYYCGNEDNGGVHTNSGVGNKAAYLMTDGGTFNGYTVRGLGYAKVADLFYEVQTHLLTSAASYPDLYDALNLACSNLGYSADDCQEVQNALNAVEMYLEPCQSSPPTTTTTTTSTTSTSTTSTSTTTSTTTTVPGSTTTTTIPTTEGLIWNYGNWNEKNWN